MKILLPEIDHLSFRLNEQAVREKQDEIYSGWELFDRYAHVQKMDPSFEDIYYIACRYYRSYIGMHFIASSQFLGREMLSEGLNIRQIHDTFYEVDRVIFIFVTAISVPDYVDFRFNTHPAIKLSSITFSVEVED